MAYSYLPRGEKLSDPSVIRCPYCVEDGNFKLMAIPESGGGHTCNGCGHVVLPSNPLFECTCTRCARFRIA